MSAMSELAGRLASKTGTQGGGESSRTARTDLCRDAMWDFTHNPIMVLVVQTCNISYISMIVWTGVNPDAESVERDVVHAISIISFIVWAFEISLKIYGHGLRTYFSTFWNVWDFMCTWSVLVDILFVHVTLYRPCNTHPSFLSRITLHYLRSWQHAQKPSPCRPRLISSLPAIASGFVISNFFAIP